MTENAFFESITEYLKSELKLFSDCSCLKCEECSGGNINHIDRVYDAQNTSSVILKRAKPEANISKEIILDTLRGKREAEILTFYNRLISGSAPDVLGYNDELHTIVLPDLKEYKVLQDCITEAERYDFIPEQLSEFISELLFFTSDFNLPPKEKKNAQKHFINPDLCDVTEKLVFSEPYACGHTFVSDGNKEFVIKNIEKDTLLKDSVALLKYRYMTEAQALIHGDLHFGSIFVNDSRIKIFDPEFSFYGPMGYDIGNVMAHFIIEYLVADDLLLKKVLKDYLMKTLNLVFEKLEKKIKNKLPETDLYTNFFVENVICEVFRDSLGYAGTECIRRVAGIAKLKKIEELGSEAKADKEKKILEAGIFLIKNMSEATEYSCFAKLTDRIL